MIHPSSVIHESALIGDEVTVGPWTYIGENVEIGNGTQIASHVVIKRDTKIGCSNTIFQFATIGDDTPDLKYLGEDTLLVIGDKNIIREGVTIHRGTIQDKAVTSIGNNNLFMAYSHIGHDCEVGNNIILTNNAAISGHVTVGDWAILSGFAAVHQYVSLGAHCFIGPTAFVYHDVPAYVTVSGNPAEPRTINREGLKRRGFSPDDIAIINKAYKILYRRGLQLEEAKQEIKALGSQCVLDVLLKSIESSTRGIIR